MLSTGIPGRCVDVCVWGGGGVRDAVTAWICPMEAGNITGDQNCTVVVVSIGCLMVVAVVTV